MKKSLPGLHALATLLLMSGTAQAAITVYTTQASFLSAISAPGTDTFNDLAVGSFPFGPITRTAGSHVYTVDTSPNSTFFIAGSDIDPWLSTNDAADAIVFLSFSGGVRGAGAFFFGSNEAGLFDAGDITVSASDAAGSVSQTIAGATTGSFLGFVSSTGLIGMQVLAEQPPGRGVLWPTVNDLTLGMAAGDPTVIPLPGSFALMAPVLLLAGLASRRRRHEAKA
jgi:hypothetical protein